MNEDNHIRQQFQSKFSDYRSPVPADGWDRLEKSLNAAAAAKMMRRRWYIGSAAAVFVLLIGSLLFLQMPVDPQKPIVGEIAPSEKTVTRGNDKLQTAELQPEKAIQKQSAPVPFVREKAKQTERYEKPSPSSNVLTAWFDRKKSVVTEQPGRQVTEELVQTEKSAEKKEVEQTKPDQLMDEFSRASEAEELFAGGVTSEKQSKIMLSFGGKGGLTSFQKTVNSPMTLRSAAVDNTSEFSSNSNPNGIKDAFMAVNTANNIAEMVHAQPVSFGFTLSKSVFDNLAVETGLIYTYLFSEAKNTNTSINTQETQHFHYLGIPLNVNYTILSLNKLQVYTSIGGMIEKDILGRRKYQAQTTNELTGDVGKEWKTEKISQENPQFSVNAGLGASYPISDNFNLYGKIGGSYHFETNNAYKTIYSDKKIMLDLNVGLRYEF